MKPFTATIVRNGRRQQIDVLAKSSIDALLIILKSTNLDAGLVSVKAKK